MLNKAATLYDEKLIQHLGDMFAYYYNNESVR